MLVDRVILLHDIDSSDRIGMQQIGSRFLLSWDVVQKGIETAEKGLIEFDPLNESILKEKKNTGIYSSVSINTRDISNTNHVLCLGLDLKPFLEKHVDNSDEFISEIRDSIMKNGGTSKLNKSHALELTKLSKILKDSD